MFRSLKVGCELEGNAIVLQIDSISENWMCRYRWRDRAHVPFSLLEVALKIRESAMMMGGL